VPHAIVRLYSARSDQDKRRLVTEVTRAVTKTISCGEDFVSVGIEDVEPKD
jgi:4-oxalocrotonate tautomerase